MGGAYIVDTFLSFWLWLVLALTYVGVIDSVKALDGSISKSLFEIAVERLLKPSLVISGPCVLVYAFLLYRFGALLYRANMFGTGAIGLIVILALAGVVLIWLRVILALVSHSNYAKINLSNIKKVAAKEPKTDVYGRAMG